MMKRSYLSLLIVLVLVGVALAAYILLRPRAVGIEGAVPIDQPPRLFPDYAGTVVPPNIAPLNFRIEEPGINYVARIQSSQEQSIEIVSRHPTIVIPAGPWRGLLAATRGDTLRTEIFVQQPKGQWRQFSPTTTTIAREEIDPYLVYRLLKPLYNLYVNMGIYQRNLEGYQESAILRNTEFDRGCVNCHTFLNNRPQTMAIHIRSQVAGKPMLLAQDGRVTTVRRPGGYLAWHPSGRLLVFSVNKLSLFYHTIGETRDVFDADSDLKVYSTARNEVRTPPGIADPNLLETWPAWSPDGRYLYFTRAGKLPVERFKEVRYDLLRISYDPQNGLWGEPELLLSAEDTGMSIHEPRVSPDGRFLLFCMSKWGNFPVYRKSSDLYMMNLPNREYRRLECNSLESDSWHSWSSNSRWIVFSSKRRDGVFAKPYFSYIDEKGRSHKPVLLPQKDPGFYDSFIKTYNVPELVTGPVPITERALATAVLDPEDPVTPQEDTPPQQHKDAQNPLPPKPESYPPDQ